MQAVKPPARRRLLLIASAVGVSLPVLWSLTSCGPDPIITPVRNLERPSDLGFVCVRSLEGVATGRPMRECHIPAEIDDQQKRAKGFGTFGLITGSARSEVAALDFDNDGLVDLDRRIPGYNQLPVGALPESISVSDDGCRAVTANRGSCDLSVINTSKLLAPAMSSAATETDAANTVTQLRVLTASGEPIRAAPFEVAFVPTQGTTPSPPLPASCDTSTQSWRAVVTFPSCDLVALVEFAENRGTEIRNGRLVSSVKVLADGRVIDTGVNPICPSDCGAVIGVDGGNADAGNPLQPPPVEPGADGAAGFDVVAADAGVGDASGVDAQTVDAGVTEAGAAPAPAVGPVGVGAVAVGPLGDRVYVGGTRSAFVTVLGIGQAGFVAAPEGTSIPLVEQPGGVTRLRLSLNPFGITKSDGITATPPVPYVGNRGHFLYAFARDGSVRVLEITGGRTPVECDVNVDMTRSPEDRVRSCVPVAEKKRRLLLEPGPGLRIPTSYQPEVAPAVPVDIAFVSVGSYALGMLLASNGAIYHINLDAPDGEALPPDYNPFLRPPTHSPRRLSAGNTNSRGGGPPRVAGDPIRDFSRSSVAFPSKVGITSALIGPRLETHTARERDQQVTRWLIFKENAPPEQVFLQWEGVLPGTPRLTGRLGSPSEAGAVAALADVGADYCRANVTVGDIVGLSACNQDLECNAQADETCFRVSPGAQGTCLPRSFVRDENLVRTCRSELASRRRYQVVGVRKRELEIGYKLDEVPRPAISPCTRETETTVCQPDAAHRKDANLPGDEGFQCLPVKAGEAGRCVKVCGARDAAGNVQRDAQGRWRLDDSLCRAGHVCADVGSDAGPLCVEGPPPRPECNPRETRYQVQVGRGYLVASEAIPNFVGSREGAPEGTRSGKCVADPALPKLFAQRIPLDAPACQKLPGTDTAVALTHDLELEPSGHNPCVFVAPNLGANRDLTEPDGVMHVKALFENPHYRFLLGNLETYVGDAATLVADVVGGFSPLRVISTGGIVLGMPTRIVTGPMDSGKTRDMSLDGLVPPPYLFVVDQGRTLTQFSRGQILRINPRPLDLTLTGGFLDSIETNSFFPIQ